MRIQNYTSRVTPKFKTDAYKSAQNSSPKDTVSLSSGNLRSSAVMTAVGFLPVAGTVSNFMLSRAASMQDDDQGQRTVRPSVGMLGAASNVVGSAMLVNGIVTGDHAAIWTGLSFLGASGLAAAAILPWKN